MQPQHPRLKQMDAPLPLQQMHTTPPLKQMHTPHPGSRWIHPTHTNTTNSVFSSTHNPQCVQVNTNTQPTLCSSQHTAPHCVQPNTMLPALNCVESNTPPNHQHFTHTVLSEWAFWAEQSYRLGTNSPSRNDGINSERPHLIHSKPSHPQHPFHFTSFTSHHGTPNTPCSCHTTPNYLAVLLATHVLPWHGPTCQPAHTTDGPHWKLNWQALKL